ncbi:ABC transporter substrate-binding protein [Vampirovibrio sp.]|uniref:ABC transporter substrate-binding protein n=1 Tax=Vampirovibrio sp. TaxID=2717857 RepID=UPI003593DA24
MHQTDHQQAIFTRQPWAGWFCLLTLLVLCLIGFSGCGKSALKSARSDTSCERVVSLSPSITEVLYALDLGPQIAGVTRYCKYPPAAVQKPKVGGYVDPDSEALLRLRPDLVALREEQTQLVGQLKGLGFRLLTVDHRNTAGILKSLDQVGLACHRVPQARALRQSLERDIEAVRRRLAATSKRPSVLVVIDRDVHAAKVHWAFVAGQDGFYDWLIHSAGGKNALPAGKKGFLQISPEGILRMNPDVIIETTASIGPGFGTLSQVSQVSQAEKNKAAEAQWASLSEVSAVKNHRVYHFNQDYMVIPGPRFPKVLRQFAQAIHPELDWNHEPTRSPVAQP